METCKWLNLPTSVSERRTHVAESLRDSEVVI